MSESNKSDSSTSDSEIDPCSSNYNPIKALYSSKTVVPIQNAPMYDNLLQFENVQSGFSVQSIPVGMKELANKRDEEKKQALLLQEKELEEKNKQRFSRFQGMTPVVRPARKMKNVLTRLATSEGPLSALKECVDREIKIKVITRNERGVRGYLFGILVAFDKQWNLALTQVLEVWQRKPLYKRKIPPAFGEPVPKGTASTISHVPQVTECTLRRGVVECTRHIPQLLVRGEHVVLINIVNS